MVGWSQAEGNVCRFNPLDTTQPLDGAPTCGSNVDGVKAYPSWADGVTETAQTLSNGDYTHIMNDLRASANPIQTANDIANSVWGTGQLAVTCITQTADDPGTFEAWGNKIINGA